jgi:hypothetical protein
MPASMPRRPLPPALLLAWVPLMAAAAPAPQQAASPCDTALEAMHAVEQRMLAEADRGRAPDPQAKAELQRLQKHAARACLGGSGERQPPPQSVLQPPISVTPPSALSPAVPVPRLPPPATVSPPPPVVAPPAPPLTTTSCNPSGCWNSEGQFMPRVGPALSSPRGLCTVQPGGLLSCP